MLEHGLDNLMGGSKIKFFSPLRHKGTKKTNNNKHFAASRLCGKVFFEF